MLNRFLTITIAAIGLLQAGGALYAFGHVGSQESACHETVEPMPTSCCADSGVDEDAVDAGVEDFCPMSDGPCRCGISSDPEQNHHDPIPLPSRERDTLPFVRGPPPKVSLIQIETPVRSLSCDGFHAYRSGITHNQKQSLLGTWRR